MKIPNKKYLIILLIVFAVTIMHLYKPLQVTALKKEKPLKIVCTTSMITDAVRHIAGDRADIVGLMGPGIDPHLYKAREGDVHALAAANVIFYNGLHLEGKMTEVFQAMQKSKRTVALAQEALKKEALIKTDFADIYDPHIWHDVLLWRSLVEYMKKVLIEIDPDYAEIYESRTRTCLDELYHLDQYVRNRAQELPAEKRIVVTAHDAFHYFAKAYGFQVVGLQGISTDAEISMRDIQDLADFIVRNKVPALFVESSIPERTIKAVQKAVQAKGWQVVIGPVLFSDALGDERSVAGTYQGMIKHNIDVIVSTLASEIDKNS